MASRFWCWTLNNYTEVDIELVKSFCEGHCSYLVYGREVGEKNKTPHLQGYLELTKKQRRSFLTKNFHGKAHYETKKGSAKEASDYCKKSDKAYFEKGLLSKGKGQRTDIEHVKELIDQGKSEKEIADSNFALWCKNYKAFERYKNLTQKKRNFKTEVEIYWGATGTGKSKHCADNYPDAYWKPKGDWWDGYDGHETVVIDEFYGWMAWDFILRLCDRYPLLVPNKGGYTNFVARKIIFTSNKDPKDWYSYDEDHMKWETLKRRINVIKEMTVLHSPP